MKVQELFEMEGGFGLVVSHGRKTGKFEDIRLVNFATDDILDGKPSHAYDMMQKLIAVAKQNNMWGSLESLLKQHSSQTAELGDDFDDTTHFVTTKYGPFSERDIGQLADKLQEA